MTGLRRSPLYDRHVALGAKMGDFGGWEMPIEYLDVGGRGGGVVKEHTAVRQAVGLFDVSHLGKASIRGPGAVEFVNTALTNDLRRIGPRQAQYTLCCEDSTGGVVDDLIAYLHSDEHVFLVPNAANTADVVRRVAAAAPTGIDVRNLHDDYGVLAVQGPRSDDVLREMNLPTDHDYMSFTVADWLGEPLVVCRTGYTGERGFELLPRSEHAAALWDAILDAGAAVGIRPCGLGARDTLRTEMGYPLHGHDLTLDITPLQARCGWAVGWDKPQFWGRTALLAEKEAGPRRRLWGLDGLERAIPRQHMAVSLDGRAVGELTSGTFSPTLRHGIGLALLDREVAEGAEVEVDVRGKAARFRVVKPPLVAASTRAKAAPSPS